ncbi:MAG: type IV toxin-antitoxin system AbiEi family antitoxin [Alphaproteobacteria bacterium]|jgi:hypothetical protein|nr:hypothetical protein [Candidatus Jidaibacter sp.]
MKYLVNWLNKNANNERYLFALQDFRGLFPHLSNANFKTLLSRAVQSGYLDRICRGIYLYNAVASDKGLILFHIAALLRADEFNYISLETALSSVGVISQVPINWISIMSSGRSSIITCATFGTIEFVHTNQTPSELANKLVYDKNCRLWRANVSLSLRDMKVAHRNCDLIDWSIANEFI